MLRQIIDAIYGRRSAEMAAAVEHHRETANRSIVRSHWTTSVIRDVRRNVRSVIETLEQTWDPD